MALTQHSFEPYKYQEYPKMVYITAADYPHNGKLAQNPEHEAEIRGDNPKWEVEPFNPYKPVDTGEKNFLTGLLDKFGAEYEKDASVSELRALLESKTEETEYNEPNILKG